MAILVSLKKQENSVKTSFRHVEATKEFQYTEDMVKQLLGGKINDIALSKGVILFSSENIDSIKIDGEEYDYDFLWNQAVSISFNQPFYGNVLIVLIDDLSDEYIKELEENFIMNDYTTKHEPGFLEELKAGLAPDNRTAFYETMTDEMLDKFTEFMDNIRKKAEELFSPEELDELINESNDSTFKNDYVTVLEYNDKNGGEEFFKDIEHINENGLYLLYKQLSKIPLSDIINILESKSVLNLELDSPKNKKYHIDIKGDKKVLSEFAEILLRHFELSEDYEFCVVLKNLQTEINKIK